MTSSVYHQRNSASDVVTGSLSTRDKAAWLDDVNKTEYAATLQRLVRPAFKWGTGVRRSDRRNNKQEQYQSQASIAKSEGAENDCNNRFTIVIKF